MKIVYLTAGAAGMYCGSCMHDNALAKALGRRGHDCMLVPVYTPIRTDELDASVDQVFLGGINLYLQQRIPWLAYLPPWLDGLLNRPGLIRRLTANIGTTDLRFLGALTVSMLRGMEGNQRKEVARLCDWLVDQIRPDRLILTNVLIGGCLPELKRRLGVPVWVTLQGDDIFLDSLPTPYRDQALEAIRRLIPHIDGFVVHSCYYRDRMSAMLNIPASRTHVTPLAIETQDFQPSLTDSTPAIALQAEPTVGYLARLAPEKGLHHLVDAFVQLHREHPGHLARLRIAGWLGPQNRGYWDEQQSKLTAAGLHDRWDYVGEVDRPGKVRFLRSIDLLCVPTTYQEPKGRYVLEAIASGVPYLQPDHGAFPELHARLGMGSLFPAKEMGRLGSWLHEELEQRASRLPERVSRLAPLRAEIDIDRLAERTLQWLE
jgi:glycosyltransferase involved in cell wall biosynthesis